jgi:ribosomal protein S27AE
MSEAITSPRKVSSEKYREYRLRAEARHPEKVRARWQTQDAIKRGKLIRQPCTQCGELKSEAHHDDYSKPLDVRWLCKKCHSVVHRGMRKRHRDSQEVCARGHAMTGHNIRLSTESGIERRRCRQRHTDAANRRRNKGSSK